MIVNLATPVIFAHRGASAHAPENTLSAFKLARDLGAKAIELDVQLSSDKKVIVFHDNKVDRITNGSGKVGQLSLLDLKRLNAGQAYGPAFENEKIATLEEVFTEFLNFPLFNIEIKNLTSPFDDLPSKVAEIIRRFKLSERVLISSFNPFALRKFSRIMPDIPLGRLFYLNSSVAIHRLSAFQLKSFFSVHVSFSALNSNLVRYLHSLGKLVFTYTLNHPDDMLRSLDTGVDGFFTDDPALAIRVLTKSNSF
jgi:glycerophosphoryl diester phosphodiesterase